MEKSANGRGRDFWLLTVLGIVTFGSLLHRAVRGFSMMTPWGRANLGLSLLAAIVAWFHYWRVQTGYSNVSEQLESEVLDRLQKSAGWLYTMVNLAIYGMMIFIPVPRHSFARLVDKSITLSDLR